MIEDIVNVVHGKIVQSINEINLSKIDVDLTNLKEECIWSMLKLTAEQ